MSASPRLFAFLLIALIAWPVAGHAQLEDVTYRLVQSTPTHPLWTCPPSVKVFKDDPVPADADDRIRVHAARNEFEPFLVVVQPTSSGNATVTVGDFGSGIETLLFQVKYVTVTTPTDPLGSAGDHPDPLWPLDSGDSVALTAGENTAFWITVDVPATTPAGDYATTVTVAGVSIPVDLHVFDFALPAKLSIASRMDFNFNTVMTRYGAGFSDWDFFDLWKRFFIDHRLTPAHPLWPGGLTTSGGAPFVDYDCGTETLSDPYGEWGFADPADRWLGGTGTLDGIFTDPFNDGAGFPSFQAVSFANNDPSQDQRPSTFCSLTRSASDWYTADNPSSSYNQAWFAYLTAMQGYLDGTGVLDASYYFVANEALDQADYDAIAWYTRYLDAAAPGLDLMVAEEPKPEIHGHGDYVADGQIDIWLTYAEILDPAAAEDRAANHGEDSWLYWLPQATSPHLTPFTLDHGGLDSRLLGWLLWKYRLRGFSHHRVSDWVVNPWTTPAENGNNGFTALVYPPAADNSNIPYGANDNRPVPSIRMELLRDGLEDYEYLRVLNGGADPAAGVANTADDQVAKIIQGQLAFTRDAEFLGNLRRLMGLFIGGEIAEIPDIHPGSDHPRANGEPGDWYLNFQDPAGQPTADPLLVGGHEYSKIGGDTYDASAGYGWYAPTDVNWQYIWVAAAPNDLQRSIMFSDTGHPAVFEFDLPVGTYDVTLSLGWLGRSFPHGRVVVEGVPLVDDETVIDNLVRTRRVQILDSRLTMEMGIEGHYTMLNHLDIEYVGTVSAVDDHTVPEAAAHRLHAAVPNPFNPRTTIGFALVRPASVTLVVHDVAGRRIRTLIAGETYPVGYHHVEWDGADGRGRAAAAGVYFYRLDTVGYTETKRMVLVK